MGKKEHIPKLTMLDKYRYEMDNMKKLLQRVSDDMVYLKRVSGDNQGNNRGQEMPPLIRAYQHPLNQPPPNLEETLTFDEIYSIFKASISTPQTVHNYTIQEATETMPPTNEHDPYVNTINCFFRAS